jgi:DNA-binding transcriptional LysR family regulator
MEWNDLRVFLAVAREGSLGAAARKLSQSQPTMGRRLRALEAATGQTLFQRTPSGFVLTHEGAAILAHAQRIEQETLAIERTLTGTEQHLDGFLRVTSSEWFGATVLAPLLAEFGTQHPGVTVELLTDARLLSLTKREADLAFRIRPFDEADVISRRLLRTQYRVYAKKGLKRPVAGDGFGTNLIALDSAFSGMPDDSWLQSMLPRARIAFRSNSRDVQACMCALGCGVAVLPQPLGERTPGISVIDLGDVPPSRDTWLGYHRDLRKLKRLRALIDLVVGRLARRDAA